MAEFRFGHVLLERLDRFHSAEPPEDRELRQLRAELTRAIDDPMLARGLARFLDATVYFASDHLVALVMERVAAGRIKVTREEAPVVDPGDALRAETLARFAEPEDEVEDPDDPNHAIAIEIIGEDDEPIAGVRYKITLPDGKVVTGRSDEQGRAFLWGLTRAGDCKVELPDLDEEAWEKVGTEPL